MSVDADQIAQTLADLEDPNYHPAEAQWWDAYAEQCAARGNGDADSDGM